MSQPQYTETQIKQAQAANTLGFVTSLIASGVAKTQAEAASLYKRACDLNKAAQVRRASVRQLIEKHLAPTT